MIRTERILLSLGISGDKGMDKLGAKIKTDSKNQRTSIVIIIHSLNPASASAPASAPGPAYYRKVPLR